MLPIALGVALSIKFKKKKEMVWVFLGDMTYETGVFYECYKYAKNFNLPIKFVVEDNNLSTNNTQHSQREHKPWLCYTDPATTTATTTIE